MKIIQIVLVLAVATLTALYFRRFRSLLLDRLIVILLGASGILFVIFPQLSDKIAYRLGVGRGADLLIYLSILGIVFIYLGLFSKVRQIEEKLTYLARDRAIQKSHAPERQDK